MRGADREGGELDIVQLLQLSRVLVIYQLQDVFFHKILKDLKFLFLFWAKDRGVRGEYPKPKSPYSLEIKGKGRGLGERIFVRPRFSATAKFRANEVDTSSNLFSRQAPHNSSHIFWRIWDRWCTTSIV